MTSGTEVGSAIWWDRSRFVHGDLSTEPLPEMVDVAGPIRVLVFGPLEWMAAGRWRLTAYFRLSEDAVGVPYNLQLVFGGMLAERPFQAVRGGRYAVALEIEGASDAHFAMRLWNARPAFRGRLWFEGASVERL